MRGAKGGKKWCMVFKGKAARSLKAVNKRSDVVVVNQKKARMYHYLMLTWIRKLLLKNHEEAGLSLIVFDSFKISWRLWRGLIHPL